MKDLGNDFFCAVEKDVTKCGDNDEKKKNTYCTRTKLAKPHTIRNRDSLICNSCYRKHPNPEQFKEEYGDDVPDDMPVWYKSKKEQSLSDFWSLGRYRNIRLFNADVFIVVACTHFGKPDDTWRPE